MGTAADISAGAALLEKTSGIRMLNGGQLAPVHANDMRAEATADEAILTFVLRSGDPAQPGARTMVAREVAVVAVSWPMLQTVANRVYELLTASVEFRIEHLDEQLQQLRVLAEQLQAVEPQQPDG